MWTLLEIVALISASTSLIIGFPWWINAVIIIVLWWLYIESKVRYGMEQHKSSTGSNDIPAGIQTDNGADQSFKADEQEPVHDFQSIEAELDAIIKHGNIAQGD